MIPGAHIIGNIIGFCENRGLTIAEYEPFAPHPFPFLFLGKDSWGFLYGPVESPKFRLIYNKEPHIGL